MKTLVKDTLRGKTIYRFFLNKLITDNCAQISGLVLDLAGGAKSSYYEYLPSKNVDFLRTNIDLDKNIDKVIDFNKPLPFQDNYFDHILFFNALYIVEDRDQFLTEVYRVLKPGGNIFISSPFIANEMPEPHDYCRLTYEGLEKYFHKLTWSSVQIIRFGERFTAVAYLLQKFFIFNIIRLLFYSLALLFDRLIPAKLKNNYPVPLGYFCILKK